MSKQSRIEFLFFSTITLSLRFFIGLTLMSDPQRLACINNDRDADVKIIHCNLLA